MSTTRARTPRRPAGFPWELVPLGLLGLGLVIVLGQRAIIGAQRYAAEYPWLPPVALAALCLVVVGGVASWIGLRVRARMEARRAHAAWLARARTLDGLRTLTPTAFERVVAEMLRAQGYRRVTHTGGSGDLCADISCVSAGGERVVVQCKRYGERKPVGSPEIQQFLGMMTIQHHAQRGLYVTTSGYTRHALALAQQHPALELIDGERLAALIQSIQ